MHPALDVLSRNWPLIAVFLSGLGFSLQTLIIKKLGEYGYHEVFVAVFFRGLVQCIVSSYYVHIGWSTPPGEEKVALFGETRRLHVILSARAVIGSLGIIFSFLAVDHLPLADAICLVMLSPLISSILSYYFLGEPWQKSERIACFVSLVGMVFVVKPSFIFGSDVALPAVGVLFGLISACSAGGAYVLVRVLGTVAKMPWENVCVAQSIGQMILALPFAYFFKEHFQLPTVPWMIALLLLGSCIGTISQILMTIGMQREKSAAAGAMRMSDIMFGFIWQAIGTADNVSVLSVLGACMIFISVCIIIFSKEVIVTAGTPSVEQTAKLTTAYNPLTTHDLDKTMHGEDDNGGGSETGANDDEIELGGRGLGGGRGIELGRITDDELSRNKAMGADEGEVFTEEFGNFEEFSFDQLSAMVEEVDFENDDGDANFDVDVDVGADTGNDDVAGGEDASVGVDVDVESQAREGGGALLEDPRAEVKVDLDGAFVDEGVREIESV